MSSGVTEGLSQGEQLSWRSPLANNQKKSWKMIVDPDVDVYSIIKSEFTGKHYEVRKKRINTEI